MAVRTKDVQEMVADFQRSLRTGKPRGYAALVRTDKRAKRAIVARLETVLREREARR